MSEERDQLLAATTAAELRTVCKRLAMPYYGEAKKHEMAAWLLTYHPEDAARLRRPPGGSRREGHSR
jgi:hypothetical protein